MKIEGQLWAQGVQARPSLAGVRDGGFPFTSQSEEMALRRQQFELFGKGRQRIVLSERARDGSWASGASWSPAPAGHPRTPGLLPARATRHSVRRLPGLPSVGEQRLFPRGRCHPPPGLEQPFPGCPRAQRI